MAETASSSAIKITSTMRTSAAIAAFAVFQDDWLVVGVRLDLAHGVVDEPGCYAAENPGRVRDLHATMRRLLGIDRKRLAYRCQGRGFLLIDAAGRVAVAVHS